MKYDLVVFDMDGTILNTLEDLADSLNVTLEHFGYPQHTIEVLMPQISTFPCISATSDLPFPDISSVFPGFPI